MKGGEVVDKKEFLGLPIDARRSILKLQADNHCLHEAIDNFREQYLNNTDQPQAVHWTVAKLLALAE